MSAENRAIKAIKSA